MPKVDKLTSNKEAIDNIKVRLFDILGLTSTNNSIVLQLFDKEVEKQQQILAMEEEIQKNFATGGWTYFRNKKNNMTVDRPYLNLIRGICNDLNINYLNKRTTIKIDGVSTNVIKYIFYI
jgi:hypothetical protein